MTIRLTVKEAACELLPARRSPVSPTSAPMLTADWRTDSRHRHSLVPVCYPISFRINLHVSDEANFTHPILAKGKYRAGQKGTTVWRLWPSVRMTAKDRPILFNFP